MFEGIVEVLNAIFVLICAVIQCIVQIVFSMFQSMQKDQAGTATPKQNNLVKANPRDPQYQTLVGLTDEAAFGKEKELPPKPTAPKGNQDFIQANPHDPNYQTLALVQNVEFVDDDRKKK